MPLITDIAKQPVSVAPSSDLSTGVSRGVPESLTPFERLAKQPVSIAPTTTKRNTTTHRSNRGSSGSISSTPSIVSIANKQKAESQVVSKPVSEAPSKKTPSIVSIANKQKAESQSPYAGYSTSRTSIFQRALSERGTTPRDVLEPAFNKFQANVGQSMYEQAGRTFGVTPSVLLSVEKVVKPPKSKAGQFIYGFDVGVLKEVKEKPISTASYAALGFGTGAVFETAGTVGKALKIAPLTSKGIGSAVNVAGAGLLGSQIFKGVSSKPSLVGKAEFLGKTTVETGAFFGGLKAFDIYNAPIPGEGVKRASSSFVIKPKDLIVESPKTSEVSYQLEFKSKTLPEPATGLFKPPKSAPIPSKVSSLDLYNRKDLILGGSISEGDVLSVSTGAARPGSPSDFTGTGDITGLGDFKGTSEFKPSYESPFKTKAKLPEEISLPKLSEINIKGSAFKASDVPVTKDLYPFKGVSKSGLNSIFRSVGKSKISPSIVEPSLASVGGSIPIPSPSPIFVPSPEVIPNVRSILDVGSVPEPGSSFDFTPFSPIIGSTGFKSFESKPIELSVGGVPSLAKAPIFPFGFPSLGRKVKVSKKSIYTPTLEATIFNIKDLKKSKLDGGLFGSGLVIRPLNWRKKK